MAGLAAASSAFTLDIAASVICKKATTPLQPVCGLLHSASTLSSVTLPFGGGTGIEYRISNWLLEGIRTVAPEDGERMANEPPRWDGHNYCGGVIMLVGIGDVVGASRRLVWAWPPEKLHDWDARPAIPAIAG
ncbi:MAG TPA: hypothetical protein VGP82_13275 [Ktedonobacterales bacterium]|jgi:hypothetical protein|nr:hypothetical protein [Ktedonobacterales bacterium]